MPRFTLNGREVEAPSGMSLLRYIRGVACLSAAKNACGEGACGACTVLIDGKPSVSCVLPLEKLEGKSVLTLEGLPETERGFYARAFAEAGAVQCGYCTPGMILAAKSLLDRNPDPSEAEIRSALKRNICRCTGYAKIVDALRLAAQRKRDLPAAALSGTETPRAAEGSGIGAPALRVDALEKAEGRARFVDDLPEPAGMLYGAALRSPYPRARLLALDVSAAALLPGVVLVATASDIPGKRFTGHIIPDWPSLIAVGEETRYVGDALALVAAESPETAQAALKLIEARFEVLEPLRSPEEALAPGAPAIHPSGNLLSTLELKRGDAESALRKADYRVSGRFRTPFTDHAFMEPESALAFPPDAEGRIRVHTGEQNVYDGRKYISDTLGLPEERVRVVSAYVGGGFGGKEDQTVQHHAALLAWLSGRPVKCTLSRAESQLVHVKRHPMDIELELGCDRAGRLLAVKARILADTGAYASLGSPVLHRAVTHLGGPYVYEHLDIEGRAAYTNNPPAGAFRGFGVPQVTFAFESLLDELAEAAGLDPWEIRFKNAARPGAALPNGQLAGPDCALEECLLALKPEYEAAKAAGKAVGLSSGIKNTGIGVGHRDVGRCDLRFRTDGVELLSGAACIGQGLGTILAQVAAETLGIPMAWVRVALPDTSTTPDSGTTTASRQTLLAGEAARKAALAARQALAERGAPAARQGLPAAGVNGAPQDSASAPGSGKSAFPYAALAGLLFKGEYEAETDPFDSSKANPVRHVAYSYAAHLVILDGEGRLEKVLAAHDSGLVVNPLAFEGQVEGGVVMGLGYALTEDFPLKDCVPQARYGTLGLLRATEVPPIVTEIVRKEALSGAGYGAKGIGEISCIPTAAAVANAFKAWDGKRRSSLPLEDTPYTRKR